MSKSETIAANSGTAGEPAALTDKALDAVTGAATGGVSPRLMLACAKGEHIAPEHQGWIDVLSCHWG